MLYNTLKKFCKPALLASLLLLAPQGLCAREYGQQDFIQAFGTDNIYRIKMATDALQFEALGDPVVFEAIAAKLTSLKEETAPLTKQDLEKRIWLMKALAYSADPKYQSLLQQYTDEQQHKKLRKYAKEAQLSLKQQQLWLPLLTSHEHWDKQQSTRDNALANALRSGKLELMREAARTITENALHKPVLLEVLSGELQQPHYLNDDRLAVDTYAWMAKALASSGQAEYESQLRAMANGNLPKSLRKHIKQYLKSYY